MVCHYLLIVPTFLNKKLIRIPQKLNNILHECRTQSETFACFAFWLDKDTVAVCWHVLSWQGVRKAVGSVSISRPWVLHQQPTSCLQSWPDLDRSGTQKRLPGNQSCVIFHTSILFFISLSKSSSHDFFSQKTCFLHLPIVTTILHANKGWASLDI